MPLTIEQQGGVRLALAVFAACGLGYGVLLPVLPTRGVASEYADDVAAALKWAAMTCVVTNAPLLAKVAQTGTERVAGTAAGGLLGYATHVAAARLWPTDVGDGSAASRAGLNTLLAAAAAAVSCVGYACGGHLNASYSMKLFAQTYILVVFGCVDAPGSPSRDAAALATSRAGGIILGVLLSEVTAVLVYPRTATQAALDKLGDAVACLAPLNDVAWRAGLAWHPGWPPRREGGGEGGGSPPAAGGGDPSAPKPPLEQALLGSGSHSGADSSSDADPEAPHATQSYQPPGDVAAVDALLSTAHRALAAAADLAPAARAEVYAGTPSCSPNSPFFLPGSPWGSPLGSWHLDPAAVEAVAACVRRTARGLADVHAAGARPPPPAAAASLRAAYPGDLLPSLAMACGEAVGAVVSAFPGPPPAQAAAAAAAFVSRAEALLQVTDRHRRAALGEGLECAAAATAGGEPPTAAERGGGLPGPPKPAATAAARAASQPPSHPALSFPPTRDGFDALISWHFLHAVVDDLAADVAALVAAAAALGAGLPPPLRRPSR